MLKEMPMKRLKAFTIISVIISMGLIACGNKPAKESSVSPVPSSEEQLPSSEIPSSLPTSSSELSTSQISSQSVLQSASEALSSLISSSSEALSSSSSISSSEIVPPSDPLAAFKENVRNNFTSFKLDEVMSTEQTETTKIDTYSDMTFDISFIANMVGSETSEGNKSFAVQDYHYVYGVTHLAAKAEELGMPKKALVDNLIAMGMFEYYNEALDVGVMYEDIDYREETVWYSEADTQYISYVNEYEGSYHHTYCSYQLDRDVFDYGSTVKEVILAIAEIGAYDASNHEITLTDEQAMELRNAFHSEDISNIKLVIENDYPKQLYMTIEGTEAVYTITDIGSATVEVPDYLPNQCDHYSTQKYDELPTGGHRLYCDHCYKYLAEKENHSFANNNDHQFCTKCQSIISLENVTPYYGSDHDQFMILYKSKENNKLYYYGYSSANPYRALRTDAYFQAYYYPSQKVLFVGKAYAKDDKLLENQYSPVQFDYSCYKCYHWTIELFENVSSSDYSFINTSLTNAQYQTFRVANEPVETYDCYNINVAHDSMSNPDIIVNDCTRIKTNSCRVCQTETSRYSTSNHTYNGNYKIVRADPCTCAYANVCAKCGYERKEDYFEDHTNAEYKVIYDAMYLKIKYGFTSLSGCYIEVSCPTCKRDFLVEADSFSEIHNNEPNECNSYEYINGKLVTDSIDILIPHILEEHSSCWVCGYIVVEVAGISFSFNYTEDENDKLGEIYLENYSSKTSVYSDLIEEASGKWTYKFYSDSEKTVLVATIEGDDNNSYIIVKNAANETVYSARSGEPLPVVA